APSSPKEDVVQFKVGDKVVYPNHGVGVIEQIMNASSGGEDNTFYRLRILANDSTVLVPTTNTTQVGLRRVLSRKDVDKVFKVLRSGKIVITNDWKGRFQENSDKMRTGDIFEVALVLKNLTYLSKSKNLSYRERKMLDKSRYLIVSEIAEVANMPEDQIEAKVDKAVSVSVKGAADN
ncbi:MAG TPA: CarD family transcriptional regulator, partial [Candidatus Polarisedimenticolia bacterium]|nr:CarD family transcriptional regulator [Candidatus Polarisedimenticolia bacterium]